MESKAKRSVSYRNKGCVIEVHEELFEKLFGGEWIKVFYVKCLTKGPLFLAEVGDVYAEAGTKEDVIKIIMEKLVIK